MRISHKSLDPSSLLEPIGKETFVIDGEYLVITGEFFKYLAAVLALS